MSLNFTVKGIQKTLTAVLWLGSLAITGGGIAIMVIYGAPTYTEVKSGKTVLFEPKMAKNERGIGFFNFSLNLETGGKTYQELLEQSRKLSENEKQQQIEDCRRTIKMGETAVPGRMNQAEIDIALEETKAGMTFLEAYHKMPTNHVLAITGIVIGSIGLLSLFVLVLTRNV